MMLRVVKLPVVAGACLLAGVLIGAALTPVLAQQLAGPDGQVAVRSDYAVYLIANGQRRWVATVMISDQEINAYPEGEPIYAGLAPRNGSAAASAPPTDVPTPIPTPTAIPAPVPPQPQPNPPVGSQPPAYPPAPNQGPSQPPVNPRPNLTPPGPLPSGSIGSTGSQAPTNPAPQVYPTPIQYPGQPYPGQTTPPQPYPGQTGVPGPSSEVDPSLPLDLSIDGSATVERPGTLRVVVRTQPGVTCDLTVRWPDGSEAPQPTRTADGQGRCDYALLVGSSAPPGGGLLRASVQSGGRVSRQTIGFQIVPNM